MSREPVIKPKLQAVRDWAQEKLRGGQEPPWAWYQYMKLAETCDALLTGMDAVKRTGSSLQLASRQGNVIQLADSMSQQDAAQHHPDDETPQMPI